MHSIIKVLVLSVFVAIAFGGTSATFTTLTTKTGTTAVATTVSNGVVVAVSTGWTIGNAIDPAGGSTTWSTVISSSGYTGVGLAGITNCGTAIPASTAALTGRGAATACPSDFATVYTTATPSGTTASTTDTQLAPATLTAPAGTAVKWVVTAPGTVGAANAVGIVVTVGTGGPLTITTTGSTSTGTTAQQNAKSSYSFGFYVETAGAASVCFQTDAQHTNDVDCAEDDTNASSVFSAAVTGFVALIALLFFN